MKCKGVLQCWRNLNLEHIWGILLAKENSREFVEGVDLRTGSEFQNISATMEMVGYEKQSESWGATTVVLSGDQRRPGHVRGSEKRRGD